MSDNYEYINKGKSAKTLVAYSNIPKKSLRKKTTPDKKKEEKKPKYKLTPKQKRAKVAAEKLKRYTNKDKFLGFTVVDKLRKLLD